jgi:hypothetical protein
MKYFDEHLSPLRLFFGESDGRFLYQQQLWRRATAISSGDQRETFFSRGKYAEFAGIGVE